MCVCVCVCVCTLQKPGTGGCFLCWSTGGDARPFHDRPGKYRRNIHGYSNKECARAALQKVLVSRQVKESACFYSQSAMIIIISG